LAKPIRCLRHQYASLYAAFVYQAAMRDEKLPRKPIEPPLPKEPAKPAP
jgi:hypothetical protein